MRKPVKMILLPAVSVVLCAAVIIVILFFPAERSIPSVKKQIGGYTVRDGFVLNLGVVGGADLLLARVYKEGLFVPAEPFQTDTYELPIHYGHDNLVIDIGFHGLRYKNHVLYDSVVHRYGCFSVYHTIDKNKIIIQHDADSYRTTQLDLSTGEVRNLFGEPDRTGMDQELLERSALHWCEIIAASDDGRYFFYSTNRNYYLKKGDPCQVYLYDAKEYTETLLFSAGGVFFMDWAERDLPVFSITKNTGDADSVLVGYDLSNHETVNLVDSKILGVRPYDCRNGFFVLKQEGKAVIYNYLTGEKIKTSLKLQHKSLNRNLFITCDKKYAILEYLVEKKPGMMYVTEFLIVNLHTKGERTFDIAEYGFTNVYSCCLLSDKDFLINSVDHVNGGLNSLILDLDSLLL